MAPVAYSGKAKEILFPVSQRLSWSLRICFTRSSEIELVPGTGTTCESHLGLVALNVGNYFFMLITKYQGR